MRFRLFEARSFVKPHDSIFKTYFPPRREVAKPLSANKPAVLFSSCVNAQDLDVPRPPGAEREKSCENFQIHTQSGPVCVPWNQCWSVSRSVSNQADSLWKLSQHRGSSGLRARTSTHSISARCFFKLVASRNSEIQLTLRMDENCFLFPSRTIHNRWETVLLCL